MYKNLLVIVFVVITIQASAQILDDSTQNVYGPETTTFTTQHQIKYNFNNYFPLDTSITNLQKFNFVNRYDNKIQNLGNIGTAAIPVFYQPPEMIGKTTGFPVYDLYWQGTDQMRYFDTRSPYTLVDIVFGGNGRNIVNVEFSRNISPTWNAGFTFRRINMEKQLAPAFQGDRQTFSTYYDVYTLYRTPDQKYSILANLARLSHEVDEQGGIDPLIDDGDSIFFRYDDSEVLLQDAQSREFKINLHIFQEYRLNNGVQLYHELDFGTEKNFYTDTDLRNDREFYGNLLIREDSTLNQFSLDQIQNEFGFKGDLASLFYEIYYKRRDLNFKQKYFPNPIQTTENYGGVYVRFDFDSLHYLRVNGEYMLGGNHVLRGEYRNQFLDLIYQRTNSAPAFIHDRYFGNHFEWYNDFNPVQSDYLFGSIRYERPNLRLKPFISLALVNNYIYFNTEKVPAQSDFAQIISPGLSMQVKFWKNFYLENEFIFTKVAGGGSDVFRIPNLFANAHLYYHNLVFDRKLELQTGLMAHYKSPYLAYAYSPVLQNFYLQNDIYVPDDEFGYVVLDAYLNFKVGQARLFLKFEHLNQSPETGYFTTPLYSGQKGTFGFGINWMFFD
ncbi:MAG: putative porin [Candidatus Cyclobacteriaceae bacterium M3_2C_046]